MANAFILIARDTSGLNAGSYLWTNRLKQTSDIIVVSTKKHKVLLQMIFTELVTVYKNFKGKNASNYFSI